MPPKSTASPPNPSGLCMCGCGQPTPIAKQSETRSGAVAGFPTKYIPRHSARRRLVIERVDRGYDTPCHIPNKTPNKANGYVYVWRDGRPFRLHRLMYEGRYGLIPEGMVIDHLCRQRDCCNPDHIEAVTVAVNTRRGDTSRLTDDDVAAIRQLVGSMTQREIAEQFGIKQPTVSDILRGKSWR